MHSDNSIFYYLKSAEGIYSAGHVQRLLEAIAGQGYALLTEEESREAFLAWWGRLFPTWHGWQNLPPDEAARLAERRARAARYTERVFTPGISEALQAALQDFTARQLQSLALHAFGTEEEGPLRAFEFTLDLGGLAPSATWEGSFFRKQDQQASIEAFEHWLGLLQLLYHSLHPYYAYAWNRDGSIPPSEPDEVLEAGPRWLYEINLFGPQLVETLGGREHLLRAPAQIRRPLDDGGVLLIPTMSFYPHVQLYDWEEVAEYLGLQSADLG